MVEKNQNQNPFSEKIKTLDKPHILLSAQSTNAEPSFSAILILGLYVPLQM